MRTLVSIALLATLVFARFKLFSSDLVMPVSGKVTAISADSVTLNMDRRLTDGITVEIAPSTLFIQEGKCASWRDVKIGAQAKAHVETSDGMLRALNVVFENPRGRNEPSPAPGAASYDASWKSLDEFKSVAWGLRSKLHLASRIVSANA